VSGAAVGTYSVVRYDPRIVAVYLVLLAALVAGLRRSDPGPAPGRAAGVLALAAAGLFTWTVPAFSYVPGPQAQTLRLVLALTAWAAAALVAALPSVGARLALVVAAAGYAGTAAAAIRLDPAPRIDVWYILQGAADGLPAGQDMYTQVWVGPPGTMAAFTYLPWTGALLAPGRWLLGDVRWALTAITVCTCLIMLLLARRTDPDRPDRAPVTTVSDRGHWTAAVLLLLPGTLTQVEQAWTEPLLLGLLAAAVLATRHRRGALAVLALALALASKQHVALLLPVFAAWPSFGPRRALASAGTAGLLILPWVIADPAAFWHDTVTLLVTFPPLKFADTVTIAVLNETGVLLPFWLTGPVLAGVLGTVCLLVLRRSPGGGELLRWCALVLLVANLLNKQAFYNQYWLVAGLVLVSWAVDGPAPSGGPSTASGSTPAPTSASASVSRSSRVRAWVSQLQSRSTQSRPARP